MCWLSFVAVVRDGVRLALSAVRVGGCQRTAHHPLHARERLKLAGLGRHLLDFGRTETRPPRLPCAIERAQM